MMWAAISYFIIYTDTHIITYIGFFLSLQFSIFWCRCNEVIENYGRKGQHTFQNIKDID
jgi:hypothetical protein